MDSYRGLLGRYGERAMILAMETGLWVRKSPNKTVLRGKGGISLLDIGLTGQWIDFIFEFSFGTYPFPYS